MTTKASWLFAVLLSAALTNGTAAQSVAPAAEKGSKLITLGTGGGPLPRKDRAQSSNLLIVNGTLYLMPAVA
jgi:hypothetical protein